jgi:hypothetical protein
MVQSMQDFGLCRVGVYRFHRISIFGNVIYNILCSKNDFIFLTVVDSFVIWSVVDSSLKESHQGISNSGYYCNHVVQKTERRFVRLRVIKWRGVV